MNNSGKSSEYCLILCLQINLFHYKKERSMHSVYTLLEI